MRAVIEPHPLRGQAVIPSSKSVAHRMMIAAALSQAPTEIRMNGINEDIEATASCLNALGAKIDFSESGCRVTPVGKLKSTDCVLDCGESGSTLRFLLPAAAALGASCTVLARGRLPERPHEILLRALRKHGVRVEDAGWPLHIGGRLTGGEFVIAGNVSSQYITGLMMALPLCPQDSEIRLTTPLESAAYVNLTLDVLAQFGIRAEKIGGGWRVFGNQRYQSPKVAAVEGDWSGAAVWLAANAMGMEVECGGLNLDSPQADRAVLDLLKKLGGEIDVSDAPDAAPALAAAAALYEGETRLIGASRLRLKESDRLHAMAEMLGALGVRVRESESELTVFGGKSIRGGEVNGYRDHRIVMAAAILGAAAEGPVAVTDVEAVKKSYPNFFETFRALGGKVRVESDR